MDALRLDTLPPPSTVLGIVEVLDGEPPDNRDAPPRQTQAVTGWPLRIGRALYNDLVLSDPHVAAHHLTIDAAEAGLQLVVGDTRNGVQLGGLRLVAGERHALPDAGAPIELTLGRTTLRLRLPGHALADERLLEPPPPVRRHAAQMATAALALMAGVQFNTWLDNDPDGWLRAAATAALVLVAVAALWSGLWALLSKTFTRRSRFGWHLRVFLYAGCALTVVGAVPNLLAFMFSLPALADFGFVGSYAVAGAAFYFHLLAVEPARPRLMRGVAIAGFAAALALTLWQNRQRTDRYGDDLYLTRLFPPALRLAKPVGTERFLEGVQALQPSLDHHAKEPGTPGGANDDDD